MKINFFFTAKFVKDLQEYIKSCGLTLSDLEQKSKISASMWHRFKQGNIDGLKMTNFVNVCTQMGVLAKDYFTHV